MNQEHDEWEARAVEAQELARDGRLDDAERLIEKLPVDSAFSGWLHEKTLALIAIASRRAEKGERHRALALLDQALASSSALGAGGSWEEADCIAQVAEIFERLAEHRRAVDLWTRAGDLAKQGQATDMDCLKILSSVAQRLAQSGEPDAGRALARSILVSEIRDRTLAAVERTDGK